MQWSEVCRDKTLQDLPDKIELNEWGNIVMSPASNRHGGVRTRIAFHLMTLMGNGAVLTGSSIMAPKGVKAAGVVWASEVFYSLSGKTDGKHPIPMPRRSVWR
ncbi:MAG: hypothetical protein BECKG1743D_GA0114223_100455 [Candidatus Kentron sp. G]|nr:MAG: hypothetical protein BECKG1743F_GA0114225_100463 [Candidatus Kentron sp. G]VFM96223.1 MAG: hypothetical protein BECKG1743E_GA0114224_100436 [Candidatus Kentron sp. G]VFM98106.1 MAG: hypothetical protein BECKG1743D_GA0114223_100455 [Candidatus Kentron sp. G]